MKSRDGAPKDSAIFRKSWAYWAAIHGYAGYPGENSVNKSIRPLEEIRQYMNPDSRVLEGFYIGLYNKMPPDALAQKVWGTCEHGTMHFFSWHRMYLYFFERVLREASGDPNFALPYWDYTSDDLAKARKPLELFTSPYLKQEDVVLLIEFIKSSWAQKDVKADVVIEALELNSFIEDGRPIANPLFEPRRTPGFGQLIQLDTDFTSIDSTLTTYKDFTQFQNTLEWGIHGYIHCLVGSNCEAPAMGMTAFAANDPLFFHHHANIDRMWSCWTRHHSEDMNLNDFLREQLTDKEYREYMNQGFHFVNEAGEPVEMTVSQLFGPNGRIDYVYDNENCFRVTPPPKPMSVAANLRRDEQTVALISVQKEIQKLHSRRTEVLLPFADDTARRALLAVARPQPNNVDDVSLATLRIKGVTVPSLMNPGSSVRILLENEALGRRERVGVIGFFALEHMPKEGFNLTYDVTRQLRDLFADGTAPEDLRVVFQAESHLRVGVWIGEIELEVRR